MEYAAATLVVVGALALVVIPLIRPSKSIKVSDVGHDAGSSDDARRAIYQEVDELQLDRRLGKLSEQDFLELRAGRMARAAELLKDDAERRDRLEQVVEAEIDSIRREMAQQNNTTPSAVSQ